MGRLGSYAGLYYAGNQADPERAKFYGDVSEKLTAISTEIIFFDLELNQIDEAVMAQGAEEPAPGALQAVDRQRPQGEALPARGEARAAVPRKGPDVGERLQPAVQRDDRRAALPRRRRARAAGARDDAQPAVEPGREKARRRRRCACQGVQGQRAAVHADHQYARQGQGDLRPLARLQGRRRQPPSRQPGRGRGGRRARLQRARRLPAPIAPLLRDEGEVARQGAPVALGSQRAAARAAGAHVRVERRAAPRARRLPRLRAGDVGGGRRVLRQATGSMRRRVPARRPAPSPRRPCRRCTRTCCSTTSASRAT